MIESEYPDTASLAGNSWKSARSRAIAGSERRVTTALRACSDALPIESRGWVRSVEGQLASGNEQITDRRRRSLEAAAIAMQAETSLRVIEKKLRKVCRLVDKHDTAHTNLLLAYFGLRAKSEESAE